MNKNLPPGIAIYPRWHFIWNSIKLPDDTVQPALHMYTVKWKRCCLSNSMEQPNKTGAQYSHKKQGQKWSCAKYAIDHPLRPETSLSGMSDQYLVKQNKCLCLNMAVTAVVELKSVTLAFLYQDLKTNVWTYVTIRNVV